MFQKCQNSIIRQASLTLDFTGGAQIVCPDPAAPSSGFFGGCTIKHPKDAFNLQLY